MFTTIFDFLSFFNVPSIFDLHLVESTDEELMVQVANYTNKQNTKSLRIQENQVQKQRKL
jgi:hypothetical protein